MSSGVPWLPKDDGPDSLSNRRSRESFGRRVECFCIGSCIARRSSLKIFSARIQNSLVSYDFFVQKMQMRRGENLKKTTKKRLPAYVA